jgi:hypothetical protein
MTMEEKQMNDPAAHKGAIEGDRPADEQNVENKGDGVDKEGLPNDPVAQAQDKEGANADSTQG